MRAGVELGGSKKGCIHPFLTLHKLQSLTLTLHIHWLIPYVLYVPCSRRLQSIMRLLPSWTWMSRRSLSLHAVNVPAPIVTMTVRIQNHLEWWVYAGHTTLLVGYICRRFGAKNGPKMGHLTANNGSFPQQRTTRVGGVRSQGLSIAPKTLANFLDRIAQLYEQGATVRRIGKYVRNWWRWVRAGRYDQESLLGVGAYLGNISASWL